LHFLEVPDGWQKMMVNHIDGDRTNNAVANLCRCRKYFPRFRGQKHWNARLFESDIAEIRRQASDRITQKDICARFGVSSGCVSNTVAQKARR